MNHIDQLLTRYPLNAKDTGPKLYSDLEMEAILCVWRVMDEWAICPFNSHADFADVLENYGAKHMRFHCVAIGQWCLRVYEAMPVSATDCFAYDWEVIPAIMDHVEWCDPNGKPHLPGIEATARKVMANLETTKEGWPK